MVKSIVDLNTSSFTKSDVFYLDTNVLLYIHYPPLTHANQQKSRAYSNFIADLRSAQAVLCEFQHSTFKRRFMW